MIDAKLLQSFMSDIEWMRAVSSKSTNSSTPSLMADSAQCDPFAEILAKTIGVLEENQSQENMPLTGINTELQLIEANMLNTWLNSGNNKSNSVTKDDIEKLFPDLANLDSMLGSVD
ncbi:MAG: hypothetical protein LBH03_05920 [Holophagales bacterium]|jgi:hypothetical protein|nr:hypothetical protein [Holophagales bacterium]